jgi:hypothetical protein
LRRWAAWAFSEGLFTGGTTVFRRATGLNGFSPACEIYMYEDLSEIYQAALEDERKRKYMKEIGDWLVEEYFEPYQAS